MEPACHASASISGAGFVAVAVGFVGEAAGFAAVTGAGEAEGLGGGGTPDFGAGVVVELETEATDAGAEAHGVGQCDGVGLGMTEGFDVGAGSGGSSTARFVPVTTISTVLPRWPPAGNIAAIYGFPARTSTAAFASFFLAFAFSGAATAEIAIAVTSAVNNQNAASDGEAAIGFMAWQSQFQRPWARVNCLVEPAWALVLPAWAAGRRRERGAPPRCLAVALFCWRLEFFHRRSSTGELCRWTRSKSLEA